MNKNKFGQKHQYVENFVSMQQLNRNQIEELFQYSNYISQLDSFKIQKILENKILGVIFFQPSTRTRLSFEIAMQKLGGKVTGFSDIKNTRSGDFYNEALSDVIKVVAQMSDCIVLRHFQSNELQKAAKFSKVPIINAGDGNNEHPTQALCDLWVIHKTFGNIDNLCIGFIGDTECRVMRSTLIGLSKFKIKKLLFLLPPEKKISENTLLFLKENRMTWELVEDIENILSMADLVNFIPFYLSDFNAVDNNINKRPTVLDDKYRLTRNKIIRLGKNIPILHCGPRGDEIDFDVDDLPQAKYFSQVKDAIFIRMALLNKLINKSCLNI